jgi:hypothetical protein
MEVAYQDVQPGKHTLNTTSICIVHISSAPPLVGTETPIRYSLTPRQITGVYMPKVKLGFLSSKGVVTLSVAYGTRPD